CIEWIFFKKRAPMVWWYSTIISITGCVLLFMHQESVYSDPTENILALGAGLSFASYMIVIRELVENYDSLSVLMVVFTISGILLASFLFIFDMSWIASFRGIGVSLQLGIVATGVAYYLFSKGLVHVSSSTAVTLALAEPLTAALLGVVIVGETLNLLS